MFGAGGGTSSYREAEDADLLVLWGSNARDAHPIFFHHVLKGVRNGARLYAVDPRRTSSAQWADAWLGIDVGSDISLANAIGREIIQAGLVNEAFVHRATTGFDAYAASVEAYPLDRAERDTGVPGDLIRQLAHDYARADRAQICWTLGITEHHNAADNVFALINLALLTGHVGRYGSGLVPLRGQNNVQGGGDMGAIPNKLSGFQDLETDLAARARFEAVYGAPVPPRPGWHLSLMFEAMERGELTACYIIGENPLRSEADTGRARKLLEGLEHFVVQDMFLTDTAKLASVVLPATATWCEAEGTVTSSERRVQRVRKALEPPPGARDDIEIICEIARRLGADWGKNSAASSGRATTSSIRASCSCTRGCGRRTRESAGRPLPSRPWSRIRRWTSCPRSSRSGSPPGVGWTRSTPACSRATTPRRSVGRRRSTSRPRTRAGWASPRASWRGCRPGGGRWRCRCTSTRRSGPGSRS